MVVQNYLTLFCFAVVPVLIAFAHQKWRQNMRAELPPWRNLMGLTAMVIASATWLFWVALFILGSYRIGLPGALGQLCLSAFLYTGPIAFIFGAALKGPSRTFTMAAGALVWMGLQTLIYS
jgi:hypothetical protein